MVSAVILDTINLTIIEKYFHPITIHKYLPHSNIYYLSWVRVVRMVGKGGKCGKGIQIKRK